MQVQRIVVAAAIAMLAAPASAQWLDYPTAGIPRTADGTPDLTAPTPRTPEGKPDISGLWRPIGGYVGNIAKDLPEELPMRPWAAEVYKERQGNHHLHDPTARCVVGGVPRSDLVGYPLKILTVPGMTVILYEAVHSYRQIFTDGRAHPVDPQPTWFGYSIGRWDGDTFVVETQGFNDTGWLDNGGHPGTDQLKVTERFRRKDFGHMEVEITVDDPKAYTKPWSMTLPLEFQPDTELLEYMCPENNKYFELVKVD